jgi:3-phenylpropionate/cinnamic acid dioxygenase small subunit
MARKPRRKGAARSRTKATKRPRARRAAPARSARAASGDRHRAVEQFLYRQAEILDERRWDEWLGLFAADGRYWMPADETQTTGDGVPNIFYEDLDLMKVRVGRLGHPRAWSQQPPNRTSHIVSNVVIEREDAKTGDVVVRSKFHVAEFRLDQLRHFLGRYRHHLKRTPSGYKIALQRVDLVNAEGPYDYVLQYWL